MESLSRECKHRCQKNPSLLPAISLVVAEQFKKREIEEWPPCQFVLVESLTGGGKTFVVKTLRNFVGILIKTRKADAALTPTGCTVALINGSTHVYLMGISTWKKLMKACTCMTGTNIDSIRHTSKMLESPDMLTMDESIMTGRLYWAQMKHR